MCVYMIMLSNIHVCSGLSDTHMVKCGKIFRLDDFTEVVFWKQFPLTTSDEQLLAVITVVVNSSPRSAKYNAPVKENRNNENTALNGIMSCTNILNKICVYAPVDLTGKNTKITKWQQQYDFVPKHCCKFKASQSLT